MSRLSYNDRQRLSDLGALRPLEALEEAVVREDWPDAQAALDELGTVLAERTQLAATLASDASIYGFACMTSDGRRIDPQNVRIEWDGR